MRIGDVHAYLDAYARRHPAYAVWQAKHWVGDVDGHVCSTCTCLTANNGARRLCPVCGTVVPLTEAARRPLQLGLAWEGVA